jgi:pimeloyl-ACP methyl ester carboxylesterase
MAVTAHIPGLVLTEREFTAPLRYSEPEGQQITLFAREVAVPEGRDRPFLVFLQGGPGMEAPRPTSHPSAPGWLERALQEYRVLMLDQRGTGRSTPIAALEQMTPDEQASYLACFRADPIVDDAELIRNELGLERWSVLGQFARPANRPGQRPLRQYKRSWKAHR